MEAQGTAQTEARAVARRVLAQHGFNNPFGAEESACVDAIATALEAQAAELATLREADGNFWEAIARAERAEAQLAEANKALEEIADAKTELTNRHDYSRGWNDALFRVRQIARSAREAQGGE